MTEALTGGCNCGSVRYEITGPLLGASYCHCTRCQRRTGTGASLNVNPTPGAFRLVAGEKELRAWRPDKGWEKWFCGSCGSSMFSRDPENPDHVGVRIGTFDEDPGVRPSYRQFVAYAPPWEPIPDDGLPRYPEARP